MARPNQESIDTFIGITGLPDTLAIQILQEYGCDLNRAVNAHFNHGHGALARGASFGGLQDDFMDVDEPVHVDPPPHMSATDLHHDSFASHHTGRREIPIEMKDDNGLPSQSDLPATSEDVSRRPHAQSSEAHGTIVIDDGDDDETSNVQSAQRVWDVPRTVPSAPVLSNVQNPDFDIEEEMIRAAIEASKKEAEGIYSSEQLDFHNGLERNLQPIGTGGAQTDSSSFEETLSRELADREIIERNSPVEHEFPKPSSQSERVEAESSFIQEQPQILENGVRSRLRSRNLVSRSEDSNTDIGNGVVSPPSSPILPQVQRNENGFPSDEWGGISSAEHDEAVMLEAAMFGGIPETSEYNSFVAHRIMHSNLNANISGPYVMPEPRPPSPTLTAQRQLREQQDDEYLASLQADIEKAEARRLEEQAARDAAREEEKRKEDERLKKLEEEQELERQLAAKEASIPQEPSADNVNAVNLLVRMPDGSRRGRRFLKSDKLKSLFDYIDIGRVVKPNTYRLVRPYPRRAFGDGDSILTLSELGLTSKQEALYLELI